LLRRSHWHAVRQSQRRDARLDLDDYWRPGCLHQRYVGLCRERHRARNHFHPLRLAVRLCWLSLGSGIQRLQHPGARQDREPRSRHLLARVDAHHPRHNAWHCSLQRWHHGVHGPLVYLVCCSRWRHLGWRQERSQGWRMVLVLCLAELHLQHIRCRTKGWLLAPEWHSLCHREIPSQDHSRRGLCCCQRL
ncbi:hypothetical protein LPJ60_004603, partial [Coemansia sp. RSA 2675]